MEGRERQALPPGQRKLALALALAPIAKTNALRGGRKGEGEKEPNLIRKITVLGGTRCKIAQPFIHR